MALSLFALAAGACHQHGAGRPGSAAYRDRIANGMDFSEVDAVWRLKDLLSADREPDAGEWQRLRDTPGYRLIHRVQDDELLEDLRTTFESSRRREYESLTKAGRSRGIRLSHLARAASLQRQLQAFRDSLVRSGIIRRAVSEAARFLPPAVTDSSAPPFVAFALFADDGYSFGDSVLVDLLHAYDSDVERFLAHEFHHTYVERIATRPRFTIERADERDLRIALENLRKEGIADLIDKPFPLPISNPAAYARKYNEEYARTPATLRALDSLLRQVAADSTRRAEAGKRARTLLWSSGHANGAYMAREIVATFGVDSLLPATKDPAAFLRTYAAAEQAAGRTPPFSPEAMSALGMLEQRYWTSSSR